MRVEVEVEVEVTEVHMYIEATRVPSIYDNLHYVYKVSLHGTAVQASLFN